MLPNLVINLENGGLGRVAQTSDGVAGMILTGSAVIAPPSEGNLQLNTVYTLSSMRDLTTLGVTKENNPLVFKEVTQFYGKKNGGELYLLVVSEATTLEQICTDTEDAPIHTLIAAGGGRIRLVGINRLPANGYTPEHDDTGIDNDAIVAGEAVHAIAQSYAAKVNPFRILLPALLWDGSTSKLYKPRQSTFDRVGYVMAADEIIDGSASAAIGQALGLAASIPVNRSLGRVKNGVATIEGYLTDGRTPAAATADLDALHDAGYIIYRPFVGRNGYYFNDDPMAAPLSNDYSNLNYGRVIDKAIILAYNAYIDEINDDIEIDDDGTVPAPMCVYYEGVMDNAVTNAMDGEISNFETHIPSGQNILKTSLLVANCSIRPRGILRDINVNLGFENPALKK